MNIRSLARKIMLLVVAIMIGVSNVIYEEDQTVNSGQHQTEQEQNEADPNSLT